MKECVCVCFSLSHTHTHTCVEVLQLWRVLKPHLAARHGLANGAAPRVADRCDGGSGGVLRHAVSLVHLAAEHHLEKLHDVGGQRGGARGHQAHAAWTHYRGREGGREKGKGWKGRERGGE